MADQRSCIGKFYSKSTLQGMTKAELIELLDIAQNNYEGKRERYYHARDFLALQIIELLVGDVENNVLETQLIKFIELKDDVDMNALRALIAEHLLNMENPNFEICGLGERYDQSKK